MGQVEPGQVAGTAPVEGVPQQLKVGRRLVPRPIAGAAGEAVIRVGHQGGGAVRLGQGGEFPIRHGLVFPQAGHMEGAADAEDLLWRNAPLHSLLDDPLHIGLPDQGLGGALFPVLRRPAQLRPKGIDGLLKGLPILHLLKISLPEGVVFLPGELLYLAVDPLGILLRLLLVRLCLSQCQHDPGGQVHKAALRLVLVAPEDGLKLWRIDGQRI